MIDPRVASGLRDVPPSVMIPRERMLAGFRKTFASFGFVPIETPHIERQFRGFGFGEQVDRPHVLPLAHQLFQL